MKIKMNDFVKQVVSFTTCFFAFLLIWILAIPFVRHFYKSIPTYIRWPLLLITTTVLGSMGLAFTAWFALLPALALEAHILIGFLWVKGESQPFKQMQRTVAFLFLILAHIGVALVLRLLFHEAWEQELTTWVSRITDYLQQSTASSSGSESTLMSRWKDLYQYIPAFYFAAFFVGYFLSFWATSLLSRIEIPSLYFWSILVSFCLAFIDLKGLKVELPPELVLVAKNVFFPLCVLYFFQGVAVLNSLFDKIKIARFWRNMWYILIILYMPVGLVLLGVAEYLFDYREKYKAERKGLE